MNSSIRERRDDIDGLRAIAISVVILFHFKTPFLHGGYLGVDVFFVISGYLIAGIVNRELSAGRFSLLDFYGRRIVRILPALFVMMGIVAIAGYFVMFSRELDALGRSIAATVAMASNLYFLFTDDYFNTGAQFQPLLHTWSLAVEEQFYLVFPVAMVLLRMRSRGSTSGVLAVVACASFALDSWLQGNNLSAAFYLPFPRAWELLIGALIAVRRTPLDLSAPMREVAGAAGIFMILYAVVFLSPSVQLPYPPALYACGGAALLILAGAGSGSLVNRALAHPIPAYIGRISYSLYLWHWPLIVGFKLVFHEPDSVADRVVLIGASLLLAALSAEFVEKPFRRLRLAPAARKLEFASAAGAVAVLLSVSLVFVETDGFAWRFTPEINRMIAYVDREDVMAVRRGTCFLADESNDMKFFSQSECLGLDPTRKNVLVLGDSFAANLRPGLVEAYPNVNFLQATAAGCLPTLHHRRLGSVCGPMLDMVFHDFLPRTKLDAIILSARWANGVDRNLSSLEDTIDYLQQFNSQIFVVGPIVEYEMPLPRILAMSRMMGDSRVIGRLRDPDPFASEAPLRAAATKHGARYLSMIDALCPQAACLTVASDGAPLQFDYGHPTREGALFIAEQWRREGVFDPG